MTILDRLRSAETGSRELDFHVYAESNNSELIGHWRMTRRENPSDWLDLDEPSWPNSGVPPYTASIDAALALVDKMLPGWDWEVGRYHRLTFQAVLWERGYRDKTQILGHGASPALAIVTALFTAIEAKEEVNHEAG